MELPADLLELGMPTGELLTQLRGEQARRRSENRLKYYRPYAKQADFHAMGLIRRERLLMAANQVGKTWAGSFEGAIHLTGRYPDWWKGARFNRPITAWAGGPSREATRDGLQRVLMGRGGNAAGEVVGTLGTGTIPKEAILSTLNLQGVADAIAVVRVRNAFSNQAPSQLIFKSYDQGRIKWQSDTVDLIIFDEEPPEDIYSEGLTRTNAVPDGRVYLTFTPLLGRSKVVRRFQDEPGVKEGTHPDRGVVTMTIDDAEHYTPEQRARIIASYPAHEREARTKGVPSMGSGAVFPVMESMISEPGMKVPPHWAKICGLDFGWDHPTAAAWLAWDRDADVVHLYDVYRVREQTPVIHSAAIKARGVKIPVAWPHDGLQHDKGSGIQLAQQYRNQGVNMLEERSTFEDGSNGVEAGIMEILDRMQTGRFKVAEHLAMFWDEFRSYHREEGLIVKDYDDILDAVRTGIMSLRYAKAIDDRPADPYSRSRGRISGSTSAWSA